MVLIHASAHLAEERNGLEAECATLRVAADRTRV